MCDEKIDRLIAPWNPALNELILSFWTECQLGILDTVLTNFQDVLIYSKQPMNESTALWWYYKYLQH